MELPAHLEPHRESIIGPCRDEDCSRILFRDADWKKLSRKVRVKLINNGCRRNEARGLCEEHYLLHREAGTLEQFAPLKYVFPKTAARDAMLEEVVHLYRSAEGVAGIARAVGLTADQLVARVEDWRNEGLIDFELAPQWSAVA